jgi:hypothetical protein
VIAQSPGTGRILWIVNRIILTAARVALPALFAALLVREWYRWPNGGPLLGPIGIFWYRSADACTLVTTVALLPMIFAFLVKPRLLTAFLSLLALAVWLALGALAETIGC